MDLDVIWMDLNTKVPYLRYFFRSEYASYLNTASTVLLGWLVVSTITHLVRLFFMHLTASIIAIILLCPTTIKWLSEQLGIDYDIIFNEIPDKFRQILKHFR
ncbi:hypothetical protein V1477_008596 [Vespula maculifrons]|uniref:Uncharacterized protein n=3 Tax=Vespula TaxID=7451 RepID=A0A834JSM0_VESGE|nr:hypothetical protein HZH66_009496 [Vespula vulgaris]KAF7393696.1 hypothetical protein HZH68_010515 [Vespula germanica]